MFHDLRDQCVLQDQDLSLTELNDAACGSIGQVSIHYSKNHLIIYLQCLDPFRKLVRFMLWISWCCFGKSLSDTFSLSDPLFQQTE